MSAQLKFTPGPWRVKSDVDPRCPWIGVSSELDETLICDACAVADAYLIAAAPDLYAALESCITSLGRANTEEGVCCCGDNMDGHSDPMDCGHIPVDMGDYYASNALSAARAALAKVRGET